MNKPDRYAVFGHPVKHSKSPLIHKQFANQTGQHLQYTAEDIPEDIFESRTRTFFASGGKGLNCTVPLKQLAWNFADKLTDRARLSKAVNTLALQEDGSILGDNTDGKGLIQDLTANHLINLEGCSVLVLGAGGATRGIVGPLLEQHLARLVIANRTPAKAYTIAQEFNRFGPVTGCGYDELKNHRYNLILNATSASLSNQLPPLPKDVLAEQGNCYDLAYSSEPTPFVRWGKENCAKSSVDGIGMLVEQAAESFFLWRGIKPETRPVINLLESSRIPA